MLACTHTLNTLRGVYGVGRGDIDRINRVALQHIIKRGKDMRNRVLCGKLFGPLLRARAYSRQLEAGVLSCALDNPVGDKVCADNTKSNLLCHKAEFIKETATIAG